MTEPPPEPRSTADWTAWAMIALGAMAILLALWDVLVERDGSAGGSVAVIAVGVVVVALGVQRRRRS